VHGRFSTNNVSMTLKFAEQGHGIAALSPPNVRSSFDSSDWSLPPMPVHAVMTSRLVPARVRVFLDFLANRLTVIWVHRSAQIARRANYRAREQCPSPSLKPKTSRFADCQTQHWWFQPVEAAGASRATHIGSATSAFFWNGTSIASSQWDAEVFFRWFLDVGEPHGPGPGHENFIPSLPPAEL
jgi:hypothetical protein